MFLEAEKSETKAPAGVVPGESRLPGSRTALSSLSSHDRRGEDALWGLFDMNIDFIHEGSGLMTYHFPKVSSHSTVTLGVITRHDLVREGHRHPVCYLPCTYFSKIPRSRV